MCLNFHSHMCKFGVSVILESAMSSLRFSKSNSGYLFSIHRPSSNRVHQRQKRGGTLLMAAVRARRVTLLRRKMTRKSWREIRPDPNGKKQPPPRYFTSAGEHANTEVSSTEGDMTMTHYFRGFYDSRSSLCSPLISCLSFWDLGWTIEVRALYHFWHFGYFCYPSVKLKAHMQYSGILSLVICSEKGCMNWVLWSKCCCVIMHTW